MFLAVIQRGAFEMLFEPPDEIGCGGKSATLGQFATGKIAVPKELHCRLQPDMVQIFVEGFPVSAALEKFGEINFRYMKMPGDFAAGSDRHEIFADEGTYFPKPFIGNLSMLAAGRLQIAPNGTEQQGQYLQRHVVRIARLSQERQQFDQGSRGRTQRTA